MIETHLDELIESFEVPDDPDAGIPGFVEKEFRAFLACGVLERGFIRLFCDRCQHEHALPFSCKGRAICPSCGARRMASTAQHLVDRVLPLDVPIRQYVVSPPFELRGLLACKSEVLTKLGQVFVRAIFRTMKKWARDAGEADPQCGAVVAIQRFTKTLGVAPHLHVLVVDGVFVSNDDGDDLRFVAAPVPTASALAAIAEEVCVKLTRYLQKAGFISADAEDGNVTPADKWFLRGLAEPSMFTGPRIVGSGIEHGGFNVHASVTVDKDDREGLERLCRYVTRPAFAEEQLCVEPDGRVQLTLRSPTRSGQRAIHLEPLAFLRRLAWLVPPPGRHQIRYMGILAAAAKDRAKVVPCPPVAIQFAFPIDNARPQRVSFRPSWCALLARVYDIDAERCPKCGGRLRPIGAVRDPDEATRHLDRQRRAQARAPPQLSLQF